MEENRDLEKILDDVKTIKTMLEESENEFPYIWKTLALGSVVVFLLGCLQFFIPVLRDLNFDQKFLYVWFPGFIVIAGYAIYIVARYWKKTKVLMTGKIKIMMYQRYILAPVGFFFLFLLREHYPMEGLILIGMAVLQVLAYLLIPKFFQGLPFLCMILGGMEFFFGWKGPEIAFINCLLISFGVGITAAVNRSYAKEKLAAGEHKNG